MLKRARALLKLRKGGDSSESEDEDVSSVDEETVARLEKGEEASFLKGGDSDSDESSSEDDQGAKPAEPAKPFSRKRKREDDREDVHPNDRPRKTRYRNKQRTLIFSSRGLKSRNRHLMNDLRELLPHSKKEAKFSEKRKLWAINEICEMRSCNNCIYFECRKNDLYMWVARVPYGPSIRFRVENIHTMDELKLTGNCLKGSRPMLVFDKNFDADPEKKVMKEIFTQAFGTPHGHPKSKPFCDHVLSFSWADGRIWFRNFQIVYDADPNLKAKSAPILVEMGPRFCLLPIRMLSGGFKGETIWLSKSYVSTTDVNIAFKKSRYQMRKEAEEAREIRQEKMEAEKPHNPLDLELLFNNNDGEESSESEEE